MKKFGIVEKSWYKNGYHCFVIFNRNGCRCGYIGISKTNKLYEKSYSEPQSFLRQKENQKFNGNVFGLFNSCIQDKDKGLPPDLYFSAHCGFTFSDFMSEDFNYNTNDNMWYFGFDCGHCDDGLDYNKAYELGLLNEKEYECFNTCKFDNGQEVKSLKYCEDLLNIIADEMIELEEWMDKGENHYIYNFEGWTKRKELKQKLKEMKGEQK